MSARFVGDCPQFYGKPGIFNKNYVRFLTYPHYPHYFSSFLWKDFHICQGRFFSKIELYTELSTLSTLLFQKFPVPFFGKISFFFCIDIINFLFLTRKNHVQVEEFYKIFRLIVETFHLFKLNFSNIYGILKASHKKELMTYALYDHRKKY